MFVSDKALMCSEFRSHQVLWDSPQYVLFLPSLLHMLHDILYVTFLLLQLPGLVLHGGQSLPQCSLFHGALLLSAVSKLLPSLSVTLLELNLHLPVTSSSTFCRIFFSELFRVNGFYGPSSRICSFSFSGQVHLFMLIIYVSISKPRLY